MSRELPPLDHPAFAVKSIGGMTPFTWAVIDAWEARRTVGEPQ